jgi:hypothetical protein
MLRYPAHSVFSWGRLEEVNDAGSDVVFVVVLK